MVANCLPIERGIALANFPEELLEALATFDSSAEEIIRPLVEEIERPGPPPLVFHYTDDTGLRGIAV